MSLYLFVPLPSFVVNHKHNDLKDYAQRFALCGKPITMVGINFDSSKGNIEDWKIED